MQENLATSMHRIDMMSQSQTLHHPEPVDDGAVTYTRMKYSEIGGKPILLDSAGIQYTLKMDKHDGRVIV